MSDLVFRTDLDGSHRVRGRGRGGERRMAGAGSPSRTRSPARSPTSGCSSARTCSARKLMPLADEGKALGVMLPNANGAAATILAAMSAGRVPAMINFTAGAANILAACKAAEIATIVTSRGFVEKAKLEPLAGALAETVRDRLSRGRPGRHRHPRQAARPRRVQEAARAARPRTTRPRSSSPRARKACRRASCSPTATCWRTPRRRRRGSISAAPTRSSTSCRCSIPSG